MSSDRIDKRWIILALVCASMFLLKFVLTDIFQSLEIALMFTGALAVIASLVVWHLLKSHGGLAYFIVLAAVLGSLMAGFGGSVAFKGSLAKRDLAESYKSKAAQGVNRGNDLPRHVVDQMKRARTNFEDQWRNLNPSKAADPTMIKSYSAESLIQTLEQGKKLVADYQSELSRITTENSSGIKLIAMKREILYKYTNAQEALLMLWRRKIHLLKQYEHNWKYENGRVVFLYAQDRVTPLPGFGEYQALQDEIRLGESRLQSVSQEYYTLFN